MLKNLIIIVAAICGSAQAQITEITLTSADGTDLTSHIADDTTIYLADGVNYEWNLYTPSVTDAYTNLSVIGNGNIINLTSSSQTVWFGGTCSFEGLNFNGNANGGQWRFYDQASTWSESDTSFENCGFNISNLYVQHLTFVGCKFKRLQANNCELRSVEIGTMYSNSSSQACLTLWNTSASFEDVYIAQRYHGYGSSVKNYIKVNNHTGNYFNVNVIMPCETSLCVWPADTIVGSPAALSAVQPMLADVNQDNLVGQSDNVRILSKWGEFLGNLPARPSCLG
mgnify:CR=1 FL=1